MTFLEILQAFNKEKNLDLRLNKVQFFMMENKLKISLISPEKLDEKLREDFLDRLDKELDLESDIKLEFIDIKSCMDLFTRELEEEKHIRQNGYKLIKKEGSDIVISIEDPFMESVIRESKAFKNLDSRLKLDDYKLIFKLVENEEKEHTEDLKKEKIKDLQRRIKKSSQFDQTIAKKKIFKYGYGLNRKLEKTDIIDIHPDPSLIMVEGTVYEIHINDIRKGQFVYFDLDDGAYAIRCKMYVNKKDAESFNQEFKEGLEIRAYGNYEFDEYENTDYLKVKYLEEIDLPKSHDLAEKKRIEFNIHTKYTNMEGLVDPKELFSCLKRWGHKSVGITDTYNVQAYPEIYPLAKKNGIKLNLGMEAMLLEDKPSILFNPFKEDLRGRDIIVFDIETTGLSRFNDRITEIGAVKIRDNEIIDIYQVLVNPQMLIPDFIVDLTGISNEMVKNERTIDQVLPEFLDFVGDGIYVAHNAEFDIGFIQENARMLNIDFNPIYIDTMWLARALRPDNKNHRLNTLAKDYNVKLLNHHRASDDAKATADIFLKMMEDVDLSINDINNIETDFETSRNAWQYNLIYVKNKTGLKNLYRLVSISSLDYLYRNPGIPRSIYEDNREGLLIGSGSHKSKLFEYISGGFDQRIIEKEASFYDFFHIEPLSFADYLIKENLIRDQRHLMEINKQIIDLANKQNKLVIATGNVYYMEKNDYIYRNILENYPIKRKVKDKGYFYLRTTNEMMDEYSYLENDIAQEIVIDNAYALDDMIEDVCPIASGTFPPSRDGAEEDLRSRTYEKAKSIYGDPLPDLVEKRLERELDSIISNGYAVLYIIARDLVLKSNEDGYLVGSRGSVGSSFAATMADITEVNPLEPHYICPNPSCKHSEFILDKSYGTGIDLPDKNCPVCGSKYRKDGFDIPFEVFLGFEGDKEPDIDLNFAGEYQSTIHKYTETIFGHRKVFRAGTLGTVADKTAYGMARKYREHYPEDDTVKLDYANINKIKRKLVGVKRTTGQHAGGLIIVPEDKDIEDFTPIQYPADQKSSGVITTHFDYHAIDENLLKLDLLGHNAPSIIRMLSDQTGLNALEIDLSDKDTMSIFNSTEKLNIKHEYSNSNSGSLGIPEFGTVFVREMLKDTEPDTFAELVRISGLSHGTDVWINNAKDLINQGVAELKDAICTRDDIMNYLISMGVEKKHAFDIMEKVRKGRGLTDEDVAAMKEKNVEDWYIDSCNKIKYMFPKAHAAAYVMMGYRIAYYKVHYPAYFYATYFTNKLADFNLEAISIGLDNLTQYMKGLKKEENFSYDDKYYVLEVAEEMLARDIDLLKPDLYKSKACEFTVVDDDKILPPLAAIENVSVQMAKSIEEARSDGEFISIEDLRKRTKLTKNAIESLEASGLVSGMQDTNQLDFFSL